MANTKNIPYFPLGVEIKEDTIRDNNISAEIPINPSAKAMLMYIDGNSTVGNIVDKLCGMYKVDEEILHKDFNNLLDGLTSRYMLNWRYDSSNRLSKFLLNFISQYRKGYRERFQVESEDFKSIYLSVFKILIRKLGVFWIFVALVYASIAIGFDFEFADNIMIDYTALFAGLMTSFTLHESIHLYSYRKSIGIANMGYVAADVMSIRVVRPADSSRPLLKVTVFGPLITGVVGIIGLLVNFFLINGIYYFQVQLFFIMYGIHILYLLPIWGDGKTIFRYLLLSRMKSKMYKKRNKNM